MMEGMLDAWLLASTYLFKKVDYHTSVIDGPTHTIDRPTDALLFYRDERAYLKRVLDLLA